MASKNRYKSKQVGKPFSLTPEVHAMIVAAFTRGAKSWVEAANDAGVKPDTCEKWRERGRPFEHMKLEDIASERDRACAALLQDAERARRGLRSRLRLTQITLATGVPVRDEDGRPVAGRYVLEPQQKALDACLRNYDPGWVDGKDIEVNPGDGWGDVAAAIAAANKAVPDDE